jgi:hypothetical protein
VAEIHKPILSQVSTARAPAVPSLSRCATTGAQEIATPAPDHGARDSFLAIVETQLKWPIALLVAHFVVSVLAVVFLAIVKILLKSAGIENDTVPGSSMTLGNWMLYLEVYASSIIIVLGAAGALVLLILGIILESVHRIREIKAAWRS